MVPAIAAAAHLRLAGWYPVLQIIFLQSCICWTLWVTKNIKPNPRLTWVLDILFYSSCWTRNECLPVHRAGRQRRSTLRRAAYAPLRFLCVAATPTSDGVALQHAEAILIYMKMDLFFIFTF